MSALPAAAPVVELSVDDLPAYCPNPSMPLWAPEPLARMRKSPELALDARGNTTLEQMTRWLRGGR